MKQLHEYDTPMTDEVMRDADRAIEACELCEDLERKLAMCRDALRGLLDCISETRGKDASQAVYVAQETLKTTEPNK